MRNPGDDAVFFVLFVDERKLYTCTVVKNIRKVGILKSDQSTSRTVNCETGNRARRGQILKQRIQK